MDAGVTLPNVIVSDLVTIRVRQPKLWVVIESQSGWGEEILDRSEGVCFPRHISRARCSAAAAPLHFRDCCLPQTKVILSLFVFACCFPCPCLLAPKYQSNRKGFLVLCCFGLIESSLIAFFPKINVIKDTRLLSTNKYLWMKWRSKRARLLE